MRSFVENTLESGTLGRGVTQQTSTETESLETSEMTETTESNQTDAEEIAKAKRRLQRRQGHIEKQKLKFQAARAGQKLEEYITEERKTQV